MSFYLKPPRGYLNLHSLEECVKERLKFYHLQDEQLETLDFQCLVEDSALDRTSHYFLRLAAHVNYSFRYVFLSNELCLLDKRLSSYSPFDLKCFLKRFKRHTQENLKDGNSSEIFRDLYLAFIEVLTKMLDKNYWNHRFNNDHLIFKCEAFTLYVPFQYCCSLIRQHEVNLSYGKAEVECKQWKKLLLSLYETYLNTVLKEMKYSRNVECMLDDDRIQAILNEIGKHSFRSSQHSLTNNFNMENIQTESKLFPPCMFNLYKVLQSTNRLAHNDRFDFSLFLKGIGTEMNHALKFWESAYSRQHNSCSKCTHDWAKNEKRYIYGIRHLYGLEGSRRNYQCRSCHFLQEKSLSTREDGGCPFKHFDDFNLRKVLSVLLPESKDDVEVIIRERRDPNKSCQLLYQYVYLQGTNRDMDSTPGIQNPVQYYLSLRENIDKVKR